MPENLILAVYLERRGSVKALTRIEAEVFGVPYPLVKGWATRLGAMSITQAMLDQLQEKIGCVNSATAARARRGLDGAALAQPAAPALTAREEYLIDCACKRVVDLLQRAGRI